MNTTLKAFYSALKPITDAGFDIEVKNHYTQEDAENVLIVKINHNLKLLLKFNYDKQDDRKVSSDCNINETRVCDQKTAHLLSEALSVSKFMHTDEFKSLIDDLFCAVRTTDDEIREHIEWAKIAYGVEFTPVANINDALPHNNRLDTGDVFIWEGEFHIVADGRESTGTVLDCGGTLSSNNWYWRYQDCLHRKIGTISKDALNQIIKQPIDWQENSSD